MQKICIVIPCYNEAVRLKKKDYLRYAEAHGEVSFFFVDDGSTDGTASVLATLQAANEAQIRFATREENRGKAETVREGVHLALQWQPFSFIGYFDADLATPLSEISLLLEPFQQLPELALSFGSRQKTDQNTIRRNPIRHTLGRVYAAFITHTLALNIYDTQCGAKIFRAAVAAPLFREPFIDRWLFDVEVFCRLKQIYRKDTKSIFREVTLREWTEKGDSRVRMVDLLSLPVRTAQIFLRYR